MASSSPERPNRSQATAPDEGAAAELPMGRGRVDGRRLQRNETRCAVNAADARVSPRGFATGSRKRPVRSSAVEFPFVADTRNVGDGA